MISRFNMRRNFLGKYNLPLIITLVAIAALRLALITKGHFWLQDELRYRYTWAFIRDLVSLQPIEALYQLFEFNLYARPGLVLFNLPSALLQVIFLILTGVKTETPMSLTIPSVVQVMALLWISWLVYRLAVRFFKSAYWGLVVVIIYSMLVNTNLYLRHITPYDTALLAYLWFLDYMLQRYKIASIKFSVGAGLMGAFLYTVYPGYYLFSLVIGFLAVLLPRNRWFMRAIVWGGSFGGLMTTMELMARLLGTSYWGAIKFAVGRVIIGDPQETPIFLYRYLWEVEGLTGKLLIICFSLFLIHFVLSFRKYNYEFRLLAIAMIGTYLLHGISGPLFGKVYYGRSIHMFFWFVVLAAMMIIQRGLKYQLGQRLVGIGMVVISLISLSQWYPKFLALEYPTDVLYSLCQNDCVSYVSFVNEDYPPDDPGNRVAPTPKWLAVNFGKFFIPVNEKQYSYDTLGGKLVYQQPHPLNFPAYQFEGHSIKERQRLQQYNYQMQLYQLQ